jgi:hypothetical protein
MGTLAVTAELHAKQQEAARKEAERAARKAPQDAAADAKGEADVWTLLTVLSDIWAIGHTGMSGGL